MFAAYSIANRLIGDFFNKTIPSIYIQWFGYAPVIGAALTLRNNALVFNEAMEDILKVAAELNGSMEGEMLDTSDLDRKICFVKKEIESISNEVATARTHIHYTFHDDALSLRKTLARYPQFNDIGVFQLEKIYATIEAISKGGDVKMFRLLGIMNQHGWGVDQSYNKAANYFKAALENSDTQVICYIQQARLEGWWPTKQPRAERGFEVLRRAMKRGDERAFVILGLIFYHGTGVEKDEKRALEYFSNPAIKHSSVALYYLVLLLLDKYSYKALTKEQIDELQEQFALLQKNIEFMKSEYNLIKNYASLVTKFIFIMFILGVIGFLLLLFIHKSE